MGTLIALAAAALAQPIVGVSGTCPGNMELRVTNLTPSQGFAVLSAEDFGQATVPRGPCEGVATGLSTEGLALRMIAQADGQGTSTRRLDVPVAACTARFVAVDVATCQISNVARFIAPGAYPIHFDPAPAGGARIALRDNEVQGPFPIGFSFPFFRDRYSSFWISSNGFIAFSPTSHGGLEGGPVPSADYVDNIVAAAWTGLDPYYYGPYDPGTIEVDTRGVAPNRRLVVGFNNVSTSLGGGTVTTQIVLYELTGAVEVHTTRLDDEPYWPGMKVTQAVENAEGTAAYSLPGRVAVPFTLVEDGALFITN